MSTPARCGEQEAKVGTQPWRIVVRRTKAPPDAGAVIRFRRAEHGQAWMRGRVTAVNADGYLFIERL